jgi:hypothetical protein
LHTYAGLMSVTDEAPRYDAHQPSPLGHLVGGVGRATDRPSRDRPVHREPGFRVGGAGGELRKSRPHGIDRVLPVPGRAYAIDGAGGANVVHDGQPHRRAVDLHLDNDRNLRKAPEHVAQRGDPHAALAERKAAAIVREAASGIDRRQLGGCPRPHRAGPARRAIERRVVTDDGDAVRREMDVELEPVGARGDSQVERGDRIFRAQRAPAAMGKHLRTRGGKERHARSRK